MSRRLLEKTFLQSVSSVLQQLSDFPRSSAALAGSHAKLKANRLLLCRNGNANRGARTHSDVVSPLVAVDGKFSEEKDEKSLVEEDLDLGEEDNLLLPDEVAEWDGNLEFANTVEDGPQKELSEHLLDDKEPAGGDSDKENTMTDLNWMGEQANVRYESRPWQSDFLILTRQNSWEDVRATLDGHEEEPAWIEVAWNQLKHLTEVPNSYLQVMAAHTMGIIKKLQPRNVAGIFHSCAKLSYLDVEMLEKMAVLVLDIKDERAFSPRQLANILYSMGIMHRRAGFDKKLNDDGRLFPSEGLLTEYCTKQMMNRQNELNQQDLSMMIYSLGLLNYKGDDRFYMALMDEVQRPWHLEKFTSVDLVTIAYGISKCKQANLRKSCLVLFQEILKPERLRSFEIQEMGLFMRCLINPAVAKLAREEINFLPLIDRITSFENLDKMGVLTLRTVALAMGIFRVKDLDIWERIVDYMMTENWIERVRPYDISMVMYAMGVGKYYREDVLKVMCDALMGSAPLTLGVNGVSNIVYGLAQLRHRNSDLVSEIVQHALEPGFFDNCSALQLSNLSFSLGQIKSRIETLPLCEKLGRYLCESGRMKDFSNKLLVNCVFGLTTAGMHESEILIPVLDELLQEERVKAMAVNEVSMTMFSLGAHGTPINASLRPMLAKLRDPNIQKQLDLKDVARVVRAIARLKVDDLELTKKIVDLLNREKIGVGSIRHQALVDMLEAHSMLNLHSQVSSRKLVREVVRSERVSQLSTYDLGRAVVAVSKVSKSRGLSGAMENMLDELVATSRLKELKCHAICAVAACLAHFRTCDRSTVHAFGCEATHLERLPRYSSAELSRLFYNLALLNPPNRAILKSISTELRLPGRVVELNPSQFVTVLKGMYLCRWNDKSLISALLNHFLKDARLAEFTPNLVANTVYGMTLIPGWQDPWVESILTKAIEPDMLSNYSNWDIGVLVYSVGRVGNSDPKFMDPLAAELIAKERLTSMSSLDLVNAFHGLSKINYEDRRIVDPLLDEVLLPSRMDSHSNEELVRVANACSGWRLIQPYRVAALIDRVTRPVFVESLRPVQLLAVLQALVKVQHKDQSDINRVLDIVTQPEKLVDLHNKDLFTLRYLLDVYPGTPETARISLDECMKARDLVQVMLPRNRL